MSKDTLVLVSLLVHIPVVTAWVGLVMFDVFASLTPGLAPAQRGRLIAWSRPYVILAIVVIMITGVWQTIHNPVGPEVTSYDTLEQLRGKTYGLALFWKHGFVLLTFALTLAVRFYFAPRLAASARPAGFAEQERVDDLQLQRLVMRLSALNLAACLGALLLATRMVYQLH